MSKPVFYPIRRGFTLVEILFALALIALLVSMLFLGATALMGQGKVKSTKVTLAALQGMLAEYDARTRLAKPPQRWRWYQDGPAAVTMTSGDFWRIPATGSPLPPERQPDALDAPGLVTETVYDENDPGASSSDTLSRNGCRQILNTQIVMGLLLSLPANRSALEKLPPEMYFTPRWVRGEIPVPGTDGVLGADDLIKEAVYYLQGTKVEYKGSRYLCIDISGGIAAGAGASLPSGASSSWRADSSPATPLLLDGWGNPILFVPGTGLRVKLLNGKEIYTPTDVNYDQTMIIISPEGKVEKRLGNPPRVLQTGRPFFASAGPDGDFSKGDDNIYSFEP